jgi:succinate dehydrogenase/fumarate reductase cytochrome b subunit
MTASNTLLISKLQAVSGLIFSLYLTAHLLNHIIALAGRTVYDKYYAAVSRVYHHPYVEIPLILVVPSFHMILGIKQAISRKGTPNTLTRVFRYCGYGLVLIYFGHVFYTRGQTIFYGKDQGFESVSYTLSNPLLKHGFFVYYALLAAAGIFHMVVGVSKALQILAIPQMRPILKVVREDKVILTTILVATTAGVLGLLAYAGVFYKINWVGYEHQRQHYERILNSYLHLVGKHIQLE